MKGQEITVEAAASPEPPSARILVVEVDLAPGTYEIAVGLLDYQGGGEAFLRGSIDVAAPATSAPPSR